MGYPKLQGKGEGHATLAAVGTPCPGELLCPLNPRSLAPAESHCWSTCVVYCTAFKKANVFASWRHSELPEPAQLLPCLSRVEVGENPRGWDLKFSV